jgi:hypothetical protein
MSYVPISLTGEPATDSGWQCVQSGRLWRVRMTRRTGASAVVSQMSGTAQMPVPRDWTFTLSAALLDEGHDVARLDAGLLIMEQQTLTIGPEALGNPDFDVADSLAAARTALLDRAEIWITKIQALHALA